MPIWATDSGERSRQGSQSSLMCAQVGELLALVKGGSVLEGFMNGITIASCVEQNALLHL